MYGDYYDWIVSSARPLGYSTAIHGISPLPVAPVELDKGLMKHKSFDCRNSSIGVQKRMMVISAAKEWELIKGSSANTFTVSLSLCISPESYSGNILKLGDITYSLDATTKSLLL